MGTNCYILAPNYCFDRTDIPMREQGFSTARATVIGNDVWIGRDVLMTPGRKVSSLLAVYYAKTFLNILLLEVIRHD